MAGGYGAGAGPHQLHYPREIVLGRSGALYVAEVHNHRVTRWGPPPDLHGLFD